MAGRKFRVPRPPALDTTAEVAAFVGLVVVSALGFAGVVTELYLAGAVVALVLLWSGARIHSVTTEGVKLAHDVKRCPVCEEPEGGCHCDG